MGNVCQPLLCCQVQNTRQKQLEEKLYFDSRFQGNCRQSQRWGHGAGESHKAMDRSREQKASIQGWAQLSRSLLSQIHKSTPSQGLGIQNMSMSVCQRFPGSSKVLIARWCQTDPKNRREGVNYSRAGSGKQGHSRSISAASQERKLGLHSSHTENLQVCASTHEGDANTFQRTCTFAAAEFKILKVSSLVVTRIPKIQTLRTTVVGEGSLCRSVQSTCSHQIFKRGRENSMKSLAKTPRG